MIYKKKKEKAKSVEIRLHCGGVFLLRFVLLDYKKRFKEKERDTDRKGEEHMPCWMEEGRVKRGKEKIREIKRNTHIRIISTSVKKETEKEREKSFSLGF